MVATTVTQAPRTSKAFFAHLDQDHGILTQDDDGQMWFRNNITDALTAITPAHCNHLSVHGEVGLAEAAALATARRGGRVAVVCSRRQEVA